jgi:hypothetical protein
VLALVYGSITFKVIDLIADTLEVVPSLLALLAAELLPHPIDLKI